MKSKIASVESTFDKLSPEVLRKHKGVSFIGITTCFICHDGNGNIFMAKRSQKARDEWGHWDVGGGGLKWGFTAKSNAIREIEEEYSATPENIEFLGYRDVFRESTNGMPTHWLAIDFIALVDRDKIKINEPDMFDESGWFTVENIPSPLHSQLNTMFETHKKILKQYI